MHATATQFNSLAESLARFVWTVDAAGRLSYCNSAWYSCTAIGEGAEFLGSYLPALHPEDRPHWRQVWQQAITSGEAYTVERRIRFRADEDYVRQLECGTPVQDSTGNRGEWVMTATDATEDQRLITQLRRSIERKDRFLALVAHEMRSPLAPISNALNLLVHHETEPLIVNQSCATMGRQVARLVRFVDDLLDLARSQNAQIHLSRDLVDLEVIVAAAVEAAQPIIAARSQNLSVVSPGGATFVDGDGGRLTQVVANLLVNAAKFTDDHGRIRVSVEREGAWALIKVRDSGIGIRGEMLGRVFDAYVQVEPGAGSTNVGLGLGLTLARHLIQLHGGTVDAYSEGLGRGSEFVVRLPIASAADCSTRWGAVDGESLAFR